MDLVEKDWHHTICFVRRPSWKTDGLEVVLYLTFEYIIFHYFYCLQFALITRCHPLFLIQSLVSHSSIVLVGIVQTPEILSSIPKILPTPLPDFLHYVSLHRAVQESTKISSALHIDTAMGRFIGSYFSEVVKKETSKQPSCQTDAIVILNFVRVKELWQEFKN